MTAQIYGMNLTPSALVNIIISTVLVAMGCPGVPGGAIIMTTILLTNMGLPLEIVGLIAGIFRLIDMANTTFNVTGDVVTTMVVARSEGMMHTLGTGAETERKGWRTEKRNSGRLPGKIKYSWKSVSRCGPMRI